VSLRDFFDWHRGLVAHAAFKDVDSFWERALPQLRAANDMRGIMLVNSNYAGSVSPSFILFSFILLL
jgi:hypothetical protein